MRATLRSGLRYLLFASVCNTPLVAFAQVQVNQKFNEQGPAPSSGPFCVSGTGDAGVPPNGVVCGVGPGQNPALYGTNVGAIQAAVMDPLNANRVYAGGVNGGVWVTQDGGKNWSPLMDKQASISISSLVFDPTDSQHNTLLAGTGLGSNGSLSYVNAFGGSGGLRNGLLYSQDGGATWKTLGSGTITNSVVAAAAVGPVLLAGTSEVSPYSFNSSGYNFQGALWRSTDSGSTWSKVSGAGMPDGPISSIVVDPTNPNRIYVAVSAKNAGSLDSTAIYVSNDTGSSWTKVFDVAKSDGVINSNHQTVIKLASGPNNTIAAGVVELSVNSSGAPIGTVTGLFYSDKGGASWSKLTLPTSPSTINPSFNGSRNFAIAIDPTEPKFVYVSGDNNGNGQTDTAPVFRINAQTNQAYSLTDANTSNGSAVHADSRSLGFLPNGDLVLTGDGGIYVRTQPRSDSGTWKGLNGPSVFQTYAVAYDGLGKRLITAAQDSGVTIQSTRNSKQWNTVDGADGINAFVNDVTLAGSGYSVFYATNQSLGQPTRIILDKNGNYISPNTANSYFGANVTFSTNVFGLNFNSPWIRNRQDPTLMALAGARVYVTQDSLTGANGVLATNVNLELTNVGLASAPCVENSCPTVTAMAYGIPGNKYALVAGTTYPEFYLSENAKPGEPPSLQKLAANGYTGGAPTSIVFDPRSIDRFYTADTEKLFGTSDKGAHFTNLTSQLPTGLFRPTATEFISNNGVNALLVGGLNNVADAQSTIAVADSDANGTLSGWRMFGQGLPNAQVGQLSYHEATDVLAVGTWGRGVFTLYDVTSYFAQALTLQFGLADNDSRPDASYLTNGTVGVRPLVKYGTGTLTIDGEASYTGPTSALAGTLIVNGSIASSPFTTIYSGATLGGTGTIGNAMISSGAMLSPGNGVGSLNFKGDVMLSPGSLYLVEVYGGTSDRIDVTGNAALGGTVLAAYTGGNLTNKYTIVSAEGGRNGTFESLASSGWPSFITASLGYTSTTAVLNLNSEIGKTAGLTPNQAAVATALDGSFNLGRGTLPALFGVPQSQLPQAMTTLSGEGITGAQETAFGTANIFTSLLMEQGAFWRSGNPVDPYGVSLNPGDGRALGYAPAVKSTRPSPEAAFAAALPEANRGRWRAWFSGYDATWRLSGQADIGIGSLRHDAAGGAGGVDYQLNPDLLLGLAFGGSSGHFSLPDRATSGQQDAVQLGLYGVQKWGQMYAAGTVSLGFFDTTTTRSIGGFGAIQTANGRFNSTAVTGRLELGWRRPWTSQISVTPFAAVQISQLWQGSFTETNSGAAATGPLGLSYYDQSSFSLPTFLGAQFDGRFQLTNDVLWLPYLRASWVHEFSRSRDISATFIALPNAAFSVEGARPAANAARVSIGANVAIKRNISFFANFDGEFSVGGQSYAGKGGLRAAW